jgi:3-methyladenine DNA glycosylase AlkD
MARYGISVKGTLGVSMPILRSLARDLRRGKPPGLHRLALGLWRSGIHEARILASLLADPDRMDRRTLERWMRQVDSWDLCDQLCLNLIDRVRGARALALKWSRRRETFVKRAGFSLMAVLAVHDKGSPDAAFLPFLAAVEREARDGRNFVKKAVNWALRQTGKRGPGLRRRSIATARRILKVDADSPAARWVARDALRELALPRRMRG